MSSALVKLVTGSLGNFSFIPLNEDDRGLPRDLITDSMESKAVWLQIHLNFFSFYLYNQDRMPKSFHTKLPRSDHF